MKKLLNSWIVLGNLLVILLLVTSCTGGGRSSAVRPADSKHTYDAQPAEESETSSLDSLGYSSSQFADGSAGAGTMTFPSGGNALPNAEPYDLTYFEDYGTNPFVSTEDENTSTFGMDVDTASYTIARRYINDGNLPDPDSIRIEEFINYFDQDYSDPKGNNIFSLTMEGAESWFGQPNYHLLRIGVKAREASMWERPAANMIFVIDVSGSMAREDRLEQVKKSLRMLAGNLRSGDRIGLVVYGSTGQVISEMTSNHDAILNSIERLVPGGSTNANHGLQLAYEMARRNYDSGKINRIILCSDGVANVGVTDADSILDQVKTDALDGIGLTTIGFGMGNYNDVMMEKLANHGDGMYYYIDTEDEANRVFRDGAAELLMVLASDAKIQVEFNEDLVDRFRLLGYENRRLNEEDFRDDSVDAGEVASGQCVTALYEIRIRDDAFRRRNTSVATVRIRYENLLNREIEEYEEYVTVGDLDNDFDRASNRFQFTAAVAEFGEILKESYWAEDSTFGAVLAVAESVADGTEEREFINLVQSLIRMDDR